MPVNHRRHPAGIRLRRCPALPAGRHPAGIPDFHREKKILSFFYYLEQK
jgi:hypothetical protein